MSIASALYRTAMPALAYGVAPFFRLSQRGRVRIVERYGDWRLPPGRYLWLHGASLGEVQGLIPLCRYIRERWPAKRLLLTATSPTGIEAGLPYVHEARLLPFDCRRFIERALAGCEFEGFVFGETELWPSLLTVLEERGVPRVLVNARISDATTKLYRLLKGIFNPHIRALTAVCAQDEDSKIRLLELGAATDRTMLSGNAKYDREPLIKSTETAQEIRQLFIEGSEPVVTLASIHPEESQVWIPAIQENLKKPLRFIIAPRHTERFDYFAAALTRAQIPFERRSELKGERRPCSNPVLLLDTLGELESVYSFSTASFLGGTIRDIGGHNPLEAAMYGVFLCAGNSRWNIKEIANGLALVGAMVDVATQRDASAFIASIADAPQEARLKGERGRAIVEQSRGATKRIISALQNVGVLPR